MIVQQIQFDDVFAANCYFYIDEKTKHGFVIDPSANADKLLKIINDNNWHIEKILLTHSHLDHIGAVLGLSKMLNVHYFGFKAAEEYLSNPALKAHFTDFHVLKAMQHFDNGDLITLVANPNIYLKVIATEGHTIDSVVFYDQKNNVAFTGDTIFNKGIGRTDIEGSGGNFQKLIQNIKNKILTLDDKTVLYPGHGPKTRVKDEKSYFENLSNFF